MIKLTGSVGRMGVNKKHDVALVQKLFAAIKIKTRFGPKPLWSRQPDGRNSRELEAAIVCFQEMHGLRATGKLECTAQTMNALSRAVPLSMRNQASVASTSAAIRGPSDPGRESFRIAAETVAKAPFPLSERKTLARAYRSLGPGHNICLSRKKDWVTSDGRFATELEIDGELSGTMAEKNQVHQIICRFITSQASGQGVWEKGNPNDLKFRSKRQLNCLKGLGTGPLSADDKKLLAITSPPREAVLVACAKGCASLIRSEQISKTAGAAEFQLLLQAIGAPNQALAKQITQAAGRGGSGAPSASNLPIHFDASADPTVVRQHSLNVLRSAMAKAGVMSIRITSTSRTPGEQARIMFELIDQRGESFAKQLYRQQVHSVIGVYTNGKQRRLNRHQIMANMEIEIVSLRMQNPTLFKHIADPMVLNTIDIAPSSISSQTAKAKFIAALKADQRVQLVIEPPLDPAIHVEIPQP